MEQPKKEIVKIIQNFVKKIEVKIHKVDIVSTVGAFFISEVRKCRAIGVQNVNNNEKEFVLNFIIKEIPTNPTYSEIYNCATAFRNENIAYNVIIPSLKKYCTRPLCTSQSIFAGDNVVLLEDLNMAGYQTIHKLNGFNNMDVVERVLRELANLHAASLIMQHKNNKLFRDICSEIKEVLYIPTKSQNLLDTQEKNIAMAVQIIEEGPQLSNTKKALTFLRDLQGKTKTLQINTIHNYSKKLAVINHGDLWAGNILINNNNNVKFIDFQIMRHCSVAADLSYFFYINLEPYFRLRCQELMLDYYLEELKTNLKNGNINLDSDLTMDWLVEEMRQFSIFGLICAIWISPVLFYDIQMKVKTEKEFKNINSDSIEASVEKMLPEHKERIIDLVYTFMENSLTRLD